MEKWMNVSEIARFLTWERTTEIASAQSNNTYSAYWSVSFLYIHLFYASPCLLCGWILKRQFRLVAPGGWKVKRVQLKDLNFKTLLNSILHIIQLRILHYYVMFFYGKNTHETKGLLKWNGVDYVISHSILQDITRYRRWLKHVVKYRKRSKLM